MQVVREHGERGERALRGGGGRGGAKIVRNVEARAGESIAGPGRWRRGSRRRSRFGVAIFRQVRHDRGAPRMEGLPNGRDGHLFPLL